jgi:PKHD-type hydroxylase
MQLKHAYYWFQNAISPDDCEKIIELGLNTIKQNQLEGYSIDGYTEGGQEKSARPQAMPQGELSNFELSQKNIQAKSTYIRDSYVAWLQDQWLYDLICPIISKGNKAAGWNFDIDHAESFQFTQYNPGGFYSWHKDGGSDTHAKYKRYIHGITQEPMRDKDRLPRGYTLNENWVGKVRKISMTINLNKPGDYEGGNLKFDLGVHMDTSETPRFHECEEIRPQGSMILFPSFIDHCVTPVTFGTRYSLVLWSLGAPFK